MALYCRLAAGGGGRGKSCTPCKREGIAREEEMSGRNVSTEGVMSGSRRYRRQSVDDDKVVFVSSWSDQ